LAGVPLFESNIIKWSIRDLSPDIMQQSIAAAKWRFYFTVVRNYRIKK